MKAFSLALAIAQIVAVASARRWYSPMSQCRISLDNYRFDLCPLLDERHNSGRLDLVLHYQTPPTITTIVYNISLNGPLPSSSAFLDDEQCVRGTRACVTTQKHPPGPDLGKDDRGAEVIPIDMGSPQSEPQQDPSVGDREDFGIYAELRDSNKFPSLSLHMHGGYYANVPQRVRIDFECVESDDDAPKISSVLNNTHVLTWATKHACARAHQTFLEDDGESDLLPENEEPGDPLEDAEDAEEPPPNQDLFMPVPLDKKGLSTIIIVCSGTALLGLGYLAMRPPAVLRKRIREIRRARFLRGTRDPKLIRWATEELEMLGVDEHEVDEMVNSRPLADEEIPLRTSRTRPNFVDYGTAH